MYASIIGLEVELQRLISRKLNKNPAVKIKSGGIMVGKYPLDNREVKIAKKLGIKLAGRPEPVTTEKLIWEDILVIVADNVPKSLFDFNSKKFKKETIVWPIPDIRNGEGEKRVEKIIGMIKARVDKFAGRFNNS